MNVVDLKSKISELPESYEVEEVLVIARYKNAVNTVKIEYKKGGKNE